MFKVIAVVGGVERSSAPVDHVHEAGILAKAMFDWARKRKVELRSVKVVRVDAPAPAPAAPAAKPKRARKGKGGAT